MTEDRSRQGKGFTTSYNLTLLVYVEVFAHITDAIAREKQLKGWRRDRKFALVESVNRDWRDPSADW